MKAKLLAVLVLSVSANAFAEDAQTTPCQKPEIPLRNASDMVIKYFKKHKDAYKACIQKYVDDQREIAKNTTDPVKAGEAHDLAEKAVVEFNEFAKELDARVQE
jgi:hypothetical protein